MAEYDAVVVGAGLGGLAAGAKLAKEGKKVLLIEQHRIVGGCATTFRRKNVSFEVSLHEIGGLDYRQGTTGKIFTELGIFDNLTFVRVTEFYRYVNDRVDVVVPDEISGARASVSDAFPGEKKAVSSFFDDIEFVRRCLLDQTSGKLEKYDGKSVGGYLDSLTSNEDLKLALTANIPYYSDDPYAMRLRIFLQAQSGYLMAGGHFVQGGSQALSDYLAKVVTSNGGEILTGQLVTEVITRGDTAVGVRYVSKKGEEGTENQATAKAVITDTGIPIIVNDLIPSLRETEYGRKVNSLLPAHSLSSIYLAFSKPLSSVGFRNYSTFVDDGIRSLREFHEREKSGDYRKKRIALVNYGAIDSGLNRDGTNVASVAMVDYMENWNGLSPVGYRKKKGMVARTEIERLNRIVPGIKEMISISEMATPKTIERYTMNPHGCALGYAPVLQQKDIDFVSEPPIKNLYVASAWTGWTGFAGAIDIGYIRAKEAIEQM